MLDANHMIDNIYSKSNNLYLFIYKQMSCLYIKLDLFTDLFSDPFGAYLEK